MKILWGVSLLTLWTIQSLIGSGISQSNSAQYQEKLTALEASQAQQKKDLLSAQKKFDEFDTSLKAKTTETHNLYAALTELQMRINQAKNN